MRTAGILILILKDISDFHSDFQENCFNILSDTSTVFSPSFRSLPGSRNPRFIFLFWVTAETSPKYSLCFLSPFDYLIYSWTDCAENILGCRGRFLSLLLGFFSVRSEGPASLSLDQNRCLLVHRSQISTKLAKKYPVVFSLKLSFDLFFNFLFTWNFRVFLGKLSHVNRLNFT